MNSLIPVSDEQAKAIGITVEALHSLLGWCGKVLGTIPEDLVGLLIGDKLHLRRAKNLLGYQAEVDQLLRARGVPNPQEVSASVALPLLEGAQNESRSELRDIWARLLANAMDPTRAGRVRTSLVELVKSFDPADALAIQEMGRVGGAVGDPNIQAPTQMDKMAASLGLTFDVLDVSLERLVEFECLIRRTPTKEENRRLFSLAPKGRLLLAAIEK